VQASPGIFLLGLRHDSQVQTSSRLFRSKKPSRGEHCRATRCSSRACTTARLPRASTRGACTSRVVACALAQSGRAEKQPAPLTLPPRPAGNPQEQSYHAHAGGRFFCAPDLHARSPAMYLLPPPRGRCCQCCACFLLRLPPAAHLTTPAARHRGLLVACDCFGT
jgi:hypothetical protein